MRLLAASMLVVALSGPACGASLLSRVGTVAWAPVRYARDRVEDLLDVFELNVGGGRGVKLDIKYGIHFFGIGEVRAWRAGNIDRRAGYWREIDTELSLFPVSLLAWPVKWVAQTCGCRQLAADARFVTRDGTTGFQHLDRKELNGNPAYIWKDTVDGYRHTRWGDSFPIGAEVHAIVGVRAMVRPLQLFDFVVGFVGIDLDPDLKRKAY